MFLISFCPHNSLHLTRRRNQGIKQERRGGGFLYVNVLYVSCPILSFLLSYTSLTSTTPFLQTTSKSKLVVPTSLWNSRVSHLTTSFLVLYSRMSTKHLKLEMAWTILFSYKPALLSFHPRLSGWPYNPGIIFPFALTIAKARSISFIFSKTIISPFPQWLLKWLINSHLDHFNRLLRNCPDFHPFYCQFILSAVVFLIWLHFVYTPALMLHSPQTKSKSLGLIFKTLYLLEKRTILAKMMSTHFVLLLLFFFLHGVFV